VTAFATQAATAGCKAAQAAAIRSIAARKDYGTETDHYMALLTFSASNSP
jgi:hypothetical protein